MPAAPAAEARTRVGSVSPVVLILALTGGLAVLAVGAGVLGSQAYPVDGRAETFARPFVFQVPSNSQIVVDAKSPDLHVLSAAPQGFEGISIWSVDDVLTDNCDWNFDAPTTKRAPGVEGLLAYFRSVPHLLVKDLGALTVDGRPAHRVDLSVSGGETPCPDDISLILWRADGLKQGEGYAVGMQVPAQGHVPLTLLDVDGATIVLEIWSGDPPTFDAWYSRAAQIVDSIRFLNAPAAEQSPAAP